MSDLGLNLVDEVSSDLRPPLGAIRGCVAAVLSEWDALDDARREELLASALEGANELAACLQALEARLEAIDRARATSLTP